VSDIDDTVIQSRVSNFLQAARTVMLGNARTRLPFPGVAAFYQALRAGVSGKENNPIFYVSSSPWNIHDVIAEFMDIQKILKGPLILRDWDINFAALSGERHMAHKAVAIRNLMELYPRLQFILVGDTSQHDPDIYREIVGEFPNRVARFTSATSTGMLSAKHWCKNLPMKSSLPDHPSYWPKTHSAPQSTRPSIAGFTSILFLMCMKKSAPMKDSMLQRLPLPRVANLCQEKRPPLLSRLVRLGEKLKPL
jgi:hypothetical protein